MHEWRFYAKAQKKNRAGKVLLQILPIEEENLL